MYVTNKLATAIIIIALAAFLTATLALACSSATRRAGDVNTDRAALAALYNATNGSSWQDDTNWLSNRPLGEWHGISTDADGRVTELSLYDNQLSGSIPSELGNLANLDTLSLYDNQLSESIPSELGNLDNLEYLYLGGNQLSGCVPAKLLDVPSNDGASLGLPLLLSLWSTDVRAPATTYMAIAAATAVPAQTGSHNKGCAIQIQYQL